jgi:methylthioribose-1-phosphate isomerase
MRRVRLPPTLRWRGDAATGRLEILDQTLLPGRVRVLRVRTVPALVDAIRRLAIRGAPALGVAGAYGVVLAARGPSPARLARRIAEARPTAVNLALGVRRALASADGPLREARRMHAEDAAACLAMGRLGARFVRPGGTYLTHCNTGALATAGIGTAFAVFVAAHRAGRRFTVLADETRPLLQGARLTALELAAHGIPGRILPDGAAGGLLARGLVDGVFVGADRVAANGDFANKVGTYPLAVLCREHGVPFYCVAPTTTVDAATPDGRRIPVEERDPEEVRSLGGRPVAPRGFPVLNPAFDVTPARLVTALVTEKGVLRRPSRAGVARLLRRQVPGGPRRTP